MLQIVFNEISAAEISNLPTLKQLQVFDEFQVTPDIVIRVADEKTDHDYNPAGESKVTKL